jgi:hypothetical protein
VNLFGRLVLTRIARPDRVAALRRLLAKHPRLYSRIRDVAFWLSTVGHDYHKILLETSRLPGNAPSHHSGVNCGTQFDIIRALNERDADEVEARSPLERLMGDVFFSLPGVQFPTGAQLTFALFKRGHSIATAIETARSRGASDRDICVGIHAYFLRSLPNDEHPVEGNDPFLMASKILGRRDFIALRNRTVATTSRT